MKKPALYLFGIDPISPKPIVAFPVTSDRFNGSPVCTRVRDAVGDLCAGAPVRFEVDADGFDRACQIIPYLGDLRNG